MTRVPATNENKELTSLLLTPQVWATMRDQGMVLVRSGFLPASVNTPEKAIAIMMKGYEVGFPPMQAFAQINVISGKPAISAEGMLALILKNCPNATIDFVKLEDTECIIEASRPNGKKTHFSYTKADAEKAQLWGKGNWLKYPRAMCRSRCVSEMARTLFPDAIMGLSHTPEELQPTLDLDEDGNVLNLAPKPSEEELKKALEEAKAANEEALHAKRAAAVKAFMVEGKVMEEVAWDVMKKITGKEVIDDLTADDLRILGGKLSDLRNNKIDWETLVDILFPKEEDDHEV